MGLKDKATFIAGIQSFCDGLNAAMAENGGSGMAGELLNPMHPLRRITKLFKMDDAGIVIEDNNYIDEAYDGNFPSKGNEFDKKVTLPIVIPLTYVFNGLWDTSPFLSGWNTEDTNPDMSEGGIWTFDKNGKDCTAFLTDVVNSGVDLYFIEAGNEANYCKWDGDVQVGQGIQFDVDAIGLNQSSLFTNLAGPWNWTQGYPAQGVDIIITTNPPV